MPNPNLNTTPTMIQKLLLLVRSLFLNFNFSQEKFLTTNQNWILGIIFFLSSFVNYGQCTYPSGASQVDDVYTFCTDLNSTFTTSNVNAGNYVLVDVVKGYEYTFSVGNVWSSNGDPNRENITLFDASNNTNFGTLGYVRGNSGASVNWIATISGRIKVLLSKNCGTASSGGTLTLTQNAVGNNLDSQTVAGANTWRGHIYNAGGAEPTPFSNANYAGYYTIPTINFNETFGSSTACIPVYSNGTVRASMYAEGFAVRYRMTYTNTAGCYLIKVTGDDGVRLSINGGTSYIFDRWVEQGATTYDYILVNLTATTNFVLDYYENATDNRVSFDIIPFNAALNTITAPTAVSFCNGGDPGVIEGSMQYNSADVNTANPYINFQWQRQVDGGGFSNISGATNRTYDPPAYLANGTANDIVYQYKRLATVNTTKVPGATCAFSESNVVTVTNYRSSAGGTVSADQIICSGTQPGNITLTGNVGIVTKWQKTTDATFNTGIVDIPVTGTTLTGATIGNLAATTYFRAVVQSGSCMAANSSSVTIRVTQTPTITLNKTNETCASSNNGTITPVLSGGLSNIRYIKLTQKYVNTDAYQQVGEIEAFEIFTGTNVARSSNGATASATSTWSAAYPPSSAIDGNISGTNNFWHSASTNINEYILVDLQSGKNIDYLKIYNRTDCCSERGQNMLLELFDASNNLVYSKTVDLYQTNTVRNVTVNVLDVFWADSATTLNRTSLDSGTYTFNYSDVGGCSANPQANIGAINADAAITSVTGANSICIGGATTPYTANGAVLGGGTGAWSSSSPLIASVDASGNVTGLAAGTTNIVYTIAGGCAGTKSASKAIVVNANATITSVTGASSICIGGTTTPYTATGVVLGGGTGTWSSSSPLIASVDVSGNVTGLVAGTTNIVYTITGGCTGTKSAQISITVTANLSPISISPTPAQAFCATSSGTLLTVAETGGGTITRQWGKRTTTGGTIMNISGATGSTYTPTGADLGVGNWLIVCTSTPTCGSVRISNEVPVSVSANINASVSIAALPSGAICSGASVTFTATPVNPGTTPSYQWYKGSTAISLATGSTYTSTALANSDAISVRMISNATPCLTGSPATSNIITMTVNPTPTAPSASVTTQPTCAVPTGTITVSSPLPGAGISYSIDGSDYSNTSGVFINVAPSVTPYNVTIRNSSGCTSTSTAVTVNNPSGKVWNGSVSTNWTTAANWTPSGVPAITDCVVIPSTGTKPEIAVGSSVNVYSITVNSGGLLTVRSTGILTVATSVNVATGGDLVFEDDSSLLQTSTDNTINTGNITYKRITAPVRRYDFTFWSSPVTRTPNYTLNDLSPDTLFDKYYSFNPGTGWIISYSGAIPMDKGKGYIVRAPQYYDITNAAVYPATFIGKPNNGTIVVTGPITGKSFLLGNPYPSGLNATTFINDNSALGADVGALYFWTHNTPPSNLATGDYTYNYISADYAVFSLTGSITTNGATSPVGYKAAPTGIIAAGQAFFISASSTKEITFTNGMRVGAANDQFFKNAKANDEGKNRLWLNLTNTQGAFKQTLIGYLDGATNSWDINYDAKTLSGNTYVDFYSLNDTQKLSIQGRAMPFDNTDLIPLGYVSSIAGDFTISIDHADGLFDSQAVYLEDKKVGKTVDLRAGNYTFTTAIGTFTDRFVLSYTNKTLGTGDFENIENGLLVSVKDKTIKITSAKELIKEVTVFDINGKLLYDKKKVGSGELQVSNLQAANQVLLVKVTLENGFTTTRKIVFQ